MRPALRLAISSLSARRSRSLLLIATLALCTALIAAVACAMNSVQASARKQAADTVGTADVRVKPMGDGRRFGSEMLDRVRAWEGVVRAEGRIEAPLTISKTLPALAKQSDGTFARADQKFSFTGIAIGLSDLSNPISPIALVEGRLPRVSGEVVIDSSLLQRLSHARNKGVPNDQMGSRDNGVRVHLRGEHPPIPDRVSNPEDAERFNRLVGARLGDEIEVARQMLPNVNISAILSDPAKAAEIAGAAGVKLTPEMLTSILAKPVKLRIVGVCTPPPFGGRGRVFTTVETLGSILNGKDQLTQIDAVLEEGRDAEAFVAARGRELPEGMLLQTTAKVTSGLDRNIEASRLGLVFATLMAFFSAGFIIATAMTTGVSERTRELAILRCVGAERGFLVRSQLYVGLIVGVLGALVGLPLGLLIAAALVRLMREQVEVWLVVPAWGLILAGVGAVACGVLGAAFPAWLAARVSPLEALASRAKTPSRAGWAAFLAVAIAAAGCHLAIVTLVSDAQWRFWLYVTVGVLLHFTAYFALSVPVTLLVTRVFAAPISALMRLPRKLVGRTIRATPYRFGFTAGSMMMGLSLLVGIWTQGSAIQRDWLNKLDFPDAFVTGLNLSTQSQQLVEALPFVDGTCAITIRSVQTDTFGVQALQQYRSTFIAFEPRAFFAMAKPQWVEGNEQDAIKALEAGGAIIVAREFQVARGVHVGDTFRVRDDGKEFDFKIVGVVTSPGLEVVSQFFAVGQDFAEQSLHAVFGSRKDLKEKFDSDAIHLLQIALKPGTDDTAAVEQIRETLAGAGILDAGSGRKVKEEILKFVRGGLFAASAVAIAAMAIAGFGVANLIIAGITARQFEFGVLQAVGAGRGLVVRLVLAEAVIIAVSAAILGTLMGAQGVFAVQRLDEALFGLELKMRPPPLPVAIGWGVTLLMTLGAAAPAIIALSRKKPRELLAAVKG